MTPTPLRSIRIPEPLWLEMKEFAKLQEISVTQLLIRLMEEELSR